MEEEKKEAALARMEILSDTREDQEIAKQLKFYADKEAERQRVAEEKKQTEEEKKDYATSRQQPRNPITPYASLIHRPAYLDPQDLEVPLSSRVSFSSHSFLVLVFFSPTNLV